MANSQVEGSTILPESSHVRPSLTLQQWPFQVFLASSHLLVPGGFKYRIFSLDFRGFRVSLFLVALGAALLLPCASSLLWDPSTLLLSCLFFLACAAWPTSFVDMV